MKQSIRVILILFFTFSITFAFAQGEHGDKHDSHNEEKEGFNTGEFILDHVGDSYDWHVATFGDFHLSIPLPVILYSKNNGGVHVFMSYKFHHGHEAYKGFEIAQEGANKGKIVESSTQKRPFLDLSITKLVFSLFLSLTLILVLFLTVAKSYKKYPDKAPRGLQSLFEPLIIFVRDDIAKPAIGEKKYEKFLPYLLTIFFFIFINNLLGLIPIFPGGANLTGNIAVTVALALITFVITTFNGNLNYWKHIFFPSVPHALKPIMIPIEIMGMFIKPFVLAVRLFANISGGHMVALGFFSLIFVFANMYGVGAGYGISVFSVLFSVFMTFLEFLVAFIQAYVFTLLSSIYFGMATEEHH